MIEGTFVMSKNAFEINRKTGTTEIIVNKLIELIKEKRLKPGDRLPAERELATLMDVSRPTLREALKALQMMNIIDIRQGAGVFVKKLNTESVVEHFDIILTLDNSLYNDLYIARKELESLIARIAAESASEECVAKLRDNITRATESLDNPELFFQLDVELHGLILQMAGNRILNVFMQSIEHLNLLARKRTNSSREIRERAVQDHLELLLAFEKHNGEDAAKAMKKHISHLQTGFTILVKEADSKTM